MPELESHMKGRSFCRVLLGREYYRGGKKKAKLREGMNAPLLILLFALGTFVSGSNRAWERDEEDVVKDVDGKLCSSPSLIRHQELLEMLNMAMRDMMAIKDDPLECERIHQEYSVVATRYALVHEQNVQNMTNKDLKQILTLVVLCDHHGKFGGKTIPEEELKEHVSPLLMGSAKEKRDFLLEMCKRVCTREILPCIGRLRLKLAREGLDTDMKPPQSRPNAEVSNGTLLKELQERLPSVIDSIKSISDEPKAFIRLHLELSIFAIDCAQRTPQQIEDMSPDDIMKILQLVVMHNRLSRVGTTLDELSNFLTWFLRCSACKKLDLLRGPMNNLT